MRKAALFCTVALVAATLFAPNAPAAPHTAKTNEATMSSFACPYWLETVPDGEPECIICHPNGIPIGGGPGGGGLSELPLESPEVLMERALTSQ